jgi:hypothetical protein
MIIFISSAACQLLIAVSSPDTLPGFRSCNKFFGITPFDRRIISIRWDPAQQTAIKLTN